jgi:acyl carrier protein
MATTDDIHAGLAAIIAEVTGLAADDVRMESALVDDLEVDSLSMVEVVVAAEERFGAPIPDAEVRHLRTVGDVVALIARVTDS